MRSPLATLLLLAGAAAGLQATDEAAPLLYTAAVYAQPVRAVGAAAEPEPALLAEIRYAADLAADVAHYEVPDDSESDAEDALYRIGIYDPTARAWQSATSVTAAGTFGKGVRPHFVLTVAAADQQTVLAAAVRGLAIDAGATRDFGPQATVVAVGAGPAPAVNRPVKLSPEGKTVEPPEEKTLLQKYWWVLIAVTMLLVSGGGSPEEEK